jgi:hypothetical protein
MYRVIFTCKTENFNLILSSPYQKGLRALETLPLSVLYYLHISRSNLLVVHFQNYTCKTDSACMRRNWIGVSQGD